MLKLLSEAEELKGFIQNTKITGTTGLNSLISTHIFKSNWFGILKSGFNVYNINIYIFMYKLN